MANYNRQHTFQVGEKLAAADLEAEFNAIQAVINGNIELSNTPSGEFSAGFLIYNASDPQFAPLGTETNATRVKNAIDTAKGAQADAKVVWVPKSLWGYVADVDYSPTMYDNTVLLVREGGLGPWYDPIAYGAKADGVQDDHDAIQAALDAAVAATGPGMKVLAFTVPGTYKNETQVDLNVGVGWMTFPGVVYSGASGFPRGAAAWHFPIALIPTGLRAQVTVPSATPGEAFFATDTKEFFVGDGADWTAFHPDHMAYATYDDSQSAGSKVTARETRLRFYVVRWSGTTNANGTGFVDLGELEAGLTEDDILSVFAIMKATEQQCDFASWTADGSNLVFFDVKDATGADLVNTPTAVQLLIVAKV